MYILSMRLRKCGTHKEYRQKKKNKDKKVLKTHNESQVSFSTGRGGRRQRIDDVS